MVFPFERWTETQEKELVWMINNGYSPACCAKHLGRSELAILYRMDKLNITSLTKEEVGRKKYGYSGLGKPCYLAGGMFPRPGVHDEAKLMRPIAEMHKDLDAFEKKHGDTYREVFGENLLSPAKMSVLLSRREKEKQEFLQFKVGDIVLVDRNNQSAFQLASRWSSNELYYRINDTWAPWVELYHKKGPVVCEVVSKDAQGNYLLKELVGNAKFWCSPLVLKKTSFPEKPKLYFDHSPMYGSVPCYVVSCLVKFKIWYHSPKTGVFKSRWVDSNKIHSI